MYLDISFRKIIPLIVIIAILILCVSATFAVKEREFGTTPFYYAVGLGWQKATGQLIYSVQLAAERLIEHARAAFGFGGADAAMRNPGSATAIPVLTYHRIIDDADGLNVTAANFKNQMEALKENGWRTITLSEFEAFMRNDMELPAKSVLITFDDGAKQSFYPVDPVLAAHDFNAVSYIILNGSKRPESTYYLSEQEIKNMLETGRWEIGSHSVAGHEPITIDAAGREGHFFSDKQWLLAEGRLETGKEFTERVTRDLVESKRDLETTYGVPIRTFAFPFGDAGEESTNFHEGNGVTIREAEEIYDIGWVQMRSGQYSFNLPGSGFLAHRIKVSPEWTGEDLLAALSRGLHKPLPYTDPITIDTGWIGSWGTPRVTNDGLIVAAAADTAGAATFLDGTGAWRNYYSEATGQWSGGYAIVMGAVKDSEHYRACAFSPGHVRLQFISGDARTTVADVDDAGIARGDVRLGIRIQGTTTQCTYNGRVVLSSSGLPSTYGGIGFQVWSENRGIARLVVTNISARDVSQERIPAGPRQNTVLDSDPRDVAPMTPNTGSVAPVVPNQSAPTEQSTQSTDLPATAQAHDPEAPQQATSTRDRLKKFIERLENVREQNSNRGRGRGNRDDGEN